MPLFCLAFGLLLCVSCVSMHSLLSMGMTIDNRIVYPFAALVFIDCCVCECVATSCFFHFPLFFFKFMGKMLINQFKIVNCMFEWLYYKHFYAHFSPLVFFYLHLSCKDVINAHLRRTLHCKLCEKNETPSVWVCVCVKSMSSLRWLRFIFVPFDLIWFHTAIKPIQSFNHFIISLLQRMLLEKVLNRFLKWHLKIK